MIPAVNAFNRWVVGCMAAAVKDRDVKDISILEALLPHHVHHQARKNKLADILGAPLIGRYRSVHDNCLMSQFSRDATISSSSARRRVLSAISRGYTIRGRAQQLRSVTVSVRRAAISSVESKFRPSWNLRQLRGLEGKG